MATDSATTTSEIRTNKPNIKEDSWVVSIHDELKKKNNLEKNARLAPTTTCNIFRVPRQVKNVKKEHFNPDLMHLGLFNEYRFNPTTNKNHAEQFRIAMAAAFLETVNSNNLKEGKRRKRRKKKKEAAKDASTKEDTWDWPKLCERVVENPQQIQKHYDLEEPHRKTEASIRWALTLDAIFLTSYLGGYLFRHDDEDKFPFPRLHEIVSEKGLSFHNRVLNDITKLENQIPLCLLRKVLEILHDIKPDQADLVLHDICDRWVQNFSPTLPGFSYNPSKNGSTKLFKFQECDHLLGCVCRMMRGGGGQDDDESPHSDPCDHSGSHSKVTKKGSLIMRGSGGGDDGQVVDPASPTNGANGVLWAEKGFVRRLSNHWVVTKTKILTNATRALLGGWYRWSSLKLKEAWRAPGATNAEPPVLDQDLTTRGKISLPSATRLRHAGIHFRGHARGTCELVPLFKPSLLKLGATLYIPSFSVLQNTELVWRNMVAYDHECETLKITNEGAGHFIYFLKFMDEIIDTQEDVWLLREGRHPVIDKNLLGSDKDLAELFNSIVQHHTVDDLQDQKWVRLRSQIDNFVKGKTRQMLLECCRYGCGKPWLVISLVAATVLLLLNFLQTLYTNLAYKP